MGTGAGRHALACMHTVDLQEGESQPGAGTAQAIAVRLLERRAGQHHTLRLRLQQLPQRGQPAFAVGVGQRNALAHFFAAGGAVVVVPFDQGQALGLGQCSPQAGLATTGHSHDDQINP